MVATTCQPLCAAATAIVDRLERRARSSADATQAT
ncbi:hypothetical protein RKD30_007086 [Streptomyces pristinaespiralis]